MNAMLLVSSLQQLFNDVVYVVSGECSPDQVLFAMTLTPLPASRAQHCRQPCSLTAVKKETEITIACCVCVSEQMDAHAQCEQEKSDFKP